jgi:hypothetical protein
VIDGLTATAKSSQLAVTYHYCDYADKRTLEPGTILGTLARNLLETIDMPREVTELISETFRDGERIPESKEVFDIVLRTIDLFTTVVLVIDGIDEIKEEDRQYIHEALKTLSTRQGVSIKLYMSCRENILAAVSITPGSSFRIQFSEVTTSMDIQSYINHSVAALISKGELVIRRPELEVTIIDALIQGAKGM